MDGTSTAGRGAEEGNYRGSILTAYRSLLPFEQVRHPVAVPIPIWDEIQNSAAPELGPQTSHKEYLTRLETVDHTSPE